MKKLLIVVLALLVFDLKAQLSENDQITINQSAHKYTHFKMPVYQGLFNGGHPSVFMQNFGGTPTTKSATPENRILGTVTYAGYNGSQTVQTGRIFVKSTAEFSVGNHPTMMYFNLGGSATCCGTTRMVIDGTNGNIGMGTTSPDTKLHIEGTSSTYSRIANSGGDTRLTFGAVTGRNIIYSQNYSGAAQTLKLQVNDENNFVINTSGDVGIGTTTTGSHKLAVEGSIGAREIKVESSGWSDFVFEKEYQLLTLEEVEQHISEKGHLPEIPSESEVMENGINLGEMDGKLLQKIEELTLYVIEMNKRVNTLEEKNINLEKENQELKSKVSALSGDK